MEVKLYTNIDSVARVSNTQTKASRQIDSDPEAPAFETSRALEARLNNLPNARPEKVETARRLVGDPEYPPSETIRQIATLLALEAKKGQGEVPA